MAVGRSSVSPSDITGNSSGNPPASYTPIFTCSASVRKCELQGVSSLNVLQMPMTGRPSNWSCGMPLPLSQLRYAKPSRSWRPNHCCERRSWGFLRGLSLMGVLVVRDILTYDDWLSARKNPLEEIRVIDVLLAPKLSPLYAEQLNAEFVPHREPEASNVTKIRGVACGGE